MGENEQPKKQRPLNPIWELALIVTQEMQPHEAVRDQVQKMNVMHLNKLKKHYDPLDIVGCWRNLQTEESVAGFQMQDAKLITVAKGDPPYIERWIAFMLELPPVWNSYQHDRTVIERAEFLKRHEFKYQATGQLNRLTYERVSELGL